MKFSLRDFTARVLVINAREDMLGICLINTGDTIQVEHFKAQESKRPSKYRQVIVQYTYSKVLSAMLEV